MILKLEKLSSTYSGRNNRESGFLLVELQISVAIVAIVVAMLYADFCQVLQGWQKMFLDIQIQDTDRYMFSILEKDLCYEGQQIVITEDSLGKTKIICQTGHAGKSYTYSLTGRSLYKTTKTTKTSGKNPLFVPDCQIVDWQARRLDENLLVLKITLEKQGRRRDFQRLLHCFNGRVIYE